jgi:hypothetical protein
MRLLLLLLMLMLLVVRPVLVSCWAGLARHQRALGQSRWWWWSLLLLLLQRMLSSCS